MRASLTALALGLLVIAALAGTGCGLKGDLYLPEDETEATPPDTDEEEDGNRPSGSPAS